MLVPLKISEGVRALRDDGQGRGANKTRPELDPRGVLSARPFSAWPAAPPCSTRRNPRSSSRPSWVSGDGAPARRLRERLLRLGDLLDFPQGAAVGPVTLSAHHEVLLELVDLEHPGRGGGAAPDVTGNKTHQQSRPSLGVPVMTCF